MTQEPTEPRSPALENLTPKLRCTFEEVRAVQRAMTNGKLVHGTGSDGHSQTVTSAESYGPALVADYLTLTAEITQMERIVNAATYLYDNRLGWGDGRSPYAHPSFWDELGRALGRDPANFCDPPDTCRSCNAFVPRRSEMLQTEDGDIVCQACADDLGPAEEDE